jgi:hypothetical protein
VTQKKRRTGNPRIKELGITTRFKPGVSGNPGGRPKTRILAEMLAAIGNEVEPKSGKTFFQVAAESLVRKVFRGDIGAFKEFADRVDGRSTQHVELTGGLQVGHHTEWQHAWDKATTEERERMSAELEDKILATAEHIKARRADTPENRYRDRLREYDRRKAAGESHEAIQADFATRPLVMEARTVH